MSLIDDNFDNVTGYIASIPTVSDTTVDGSYVGLGSLPMTSIQVGRSSTSLIRLYLRTIVTSSGAGGDIRFDDVKLKLYYY